MDWIQTKDWLPEELQTVWAYDSKTGFVALACVVYGENGWLWALSNGVLYAKDRKIVSECVLDDNYNFTHWLPLPELPV